MPVILLQNRKFSYTVLRKSIRSINLRLVDDATLKVTCPRFTPPSTIEKFLIGHQNWIIKNTLKISPKKSIADLRVIAILGESHDLIVRHTTRDSVVIFHEEHKIYANTSNLSEGHLKKLLDTKFRPLAFKLITSELQSLSQIYGFKFNRITVKNTTSRFGSCSHNNNLNFNWQIILMPPELFRHVLIHELCHTVHHNHSQSYWRLVADCDPDWLLHRRLLRQEGSKYFIV